MPVAARTFSTSTSTSTPNTPLLDGASRPEELAKRVSALGMPACAITDHGNMFGAVEFYSAMKKSGVKPIIG